jgi:hypothetical protein
MRPGCGNASPRNLFRGDLLPFPNAAAPAVGIRAMMMLGNSETSAAQVLLDASA